MKEESLDTPVLFLVFNRPDVTKRVFERIRVVKPKQLFVAADGPRLTHPDDEQKCEEVRKIASSVDWDCELKTLFREENMGCGKAVSSAIDWFFEHVDMGIILEDDIVPDHSFFPFCQHLLQKYKDDSRVMMISGLNICEQWKEDVQDYHFSYFGGIWGWASWKRAWAHYDFHLTAWAVPHIRQLILHFFPTEIRGYREGMYDKLAAGKIDTWDLQWTFAKILNSGLTIIPAHNLIKNIGCIGQSGTHVTNGHPWSNLKVNPVNSLIRNNPIVMSDVEYDLCHLGWEKHDPILDKAVRMLKKKAEKIFTKVL
ncbi:nucleotide-diphospho-sugar transferase [Porifericola rhodea]|uniref:nucleotide-diphospho-sugar transferase n=1 Tax=Porifericola rhodea TaxID=930972 RepID=UPI002666AC31|nr:nucleotide-diphospho-sugar transferase [Porifericola rhodea]WKN29788.1 nucleotide-diphospho-sugar transferase [Porifericola rhodea]